MLDTQQFGSRLFTARINQMALFALILLGGTEKRVWIPLNDILTVALFPRARRRRLLRRASSIPSFHTMAKVSVTTRDCCRSSAYRSTRGLSLCSGMLGIRS